MLRVCWKRLNAHRTPLAVACFADRRLFADDPNVPPVCEDTLSKERGDRERYTFLEFCFY
jgi:hypothetical protein